MNNILDKCNQLNSAKAIYGFLKKILPESSYPMLAGLKQLVEAERIYGPMKVAAMRELNEPSLLALIETVSSGDYDENELSSLIAQETSKINQNDQKPVKRANSKYMSKSELWSWLKQKSKRQLFFCEEQSALRVGDYFYKVQSKINENKVPALIEKKKIKWDRSSVEREDFIVTVETDVVNPLSCLLQFSHVGKFTFVEEKTFITPPDLPEVPKKPKEIDPELLKSAQNLMMGLLIALVGVALMATVSSGLGFVLLLVGGIIVFGAYAASQKIKEIQEYNATCAEQEKRWRDAWNNWENSIFIHSFQEDINGQLSRIYDSVFECVKQVNDELFKDTKSIEQEDQSDMNELESMISRRKEDYR